MKKSEQAVCSNCGWSGDALGLTHCPECHQELISLDSDKLESRLGQEKYPSEAVAKVEDEDDSVQ